MTDSIHLIERDYINSMLGIDQVDTGPTNVQHETIDHSEAFTQQEITCRVFDIAGMNIAVPASSIREIIMPPVSINTDGDSRPSMLAGTFDHHGENIDVIDIEYLIMNKSSDIRQAVTGVVLLNGSSDGFIYEEPPDNQAISSQQIHWRDAKSQRLWLAGTVSQLGMALLDVDGMLRLLQAQNEIKRGNRNGKCTYRR